ncbi:MAG: lipid-binding SYLF domain-containing protein, partial [Syntrophobacteraceae bacterium]
MMKKQLLRSFMAFSVLWFVGAGATSALASNQSSTVSSAARDLKIAMHTKSIQPQQLQQAYGLAIIPSYWKAALVGGWQHGVGVLMVKTGNNKWSNPTFISVSGGSLGAQVGFMAGDMIMLFKNKQQVDQIMNGRFRLGVSAAAAAGPGEKSQTSTSSADVSTYVDTRGGVVVGRPKRISSYDRFLLPGI